MNDLSPRTLALLCITVAGCATLQRPVELPSADTAARGPFTVFSAAPLANRQELLEELDRLQSDIETTLPLVGRLGREPRQVVAETAVAGALPNAAQQILIYIFAEPQSYRLYMSAHYPTLPHRRAYFIRNGDRLAVYTCFSDRVLEDLRHELTHAVLSARVGTLPLWLDEGLAEYFEVPGGFNAPHAAALAEELDHGWKPDLARLEALDEVADMDQQDYREAWAWVHMLLTRGGTVRQALVDYLMSLHNGDQPTPFNLKLAAALPEHGRELVKHLQETGTATAVLGSG